MADYYGHEKKRLSKIWIAAILIGIALLYAGLLFGIKAIGNKLERRETTETVGSLDGRFDSEVLTMEYDGNTWTYRSSDLTNLLLIGVDWEDTEETISERYANQADFLFLITIDKTNRIVSTMQLDRDTMTDIRIYSPFGDYTGTQEEQICLSHAYCDDEQENCENTAWAVSNMLGGIPIDGYLSLDMSSIAVLNDALGGVTVTLEDDFTMYDPEMTAGTTLTLHGEQAEYYVRGRMEVGDGTNSGRMRRQLEFIRAAEKLLIEKMNEDADSVGTLYDALDGHMTTNIDRSRLVDRAYECMTYERPDTVVPVGSHNVGTDGFMEFHVDEDALKKLVAESFFQQA